MLVLDPPRAAGAGRDAAATEQLVLFGEAAAPARRPARRPRPRPRPSTPDSRAVAARRARMFRDRESMREILARADFEFCVPAIAAVCASKLLGGFDDIVTDHDDALEELGLQFEDIVLDAVAHLMRVKGWRFP